jgi:hypothetical protein
MTDILENIAYRNLISPSNLFSSEKEVMDFLNIESTVEDLKAFLLACEQEELYEYCLLIKNKLNESRN